LLANGVEKIKYNSCQLCKEYMHYNTQHKGFVCDTQHNNYQVTI
jgi:hypothetical protein